MAEYTKRSWKLQEAVGQNSLRGELNTIRDVSFPLPPRKGRKNVTEAWNTESSKK